MRSEDLEHGVRLVSRSGYWYTLDEGASATIRRVLKYKPLGKNRYGLRVTIEDGVVVGWEKKG